MEAKQKADNDNRANQLNPNNPEQAGRPAGWQGNKEKAAMDNKANQQNPEHSPSKGEKK